jgi:PrtD family type I secretion system ABC transporter
MNLREVFSKCRPFFVYGGIFSLATNFLGLASSFYMMTIFDRVLPSRSNETLAVITVFFVFVLVIDAVLDSFRSRLFAQLGDTLYLRLRKPVLDAVLRFRQQGGAASGHGLDDLDIVKGFLAGSGLKAAFEIPWIPVFLWVLWLFHPLLSIIAMVSALILFGLTYLENVVAKKNQSQANLKQRESGDFIHRAFGNAEVVTALAMQANVQQRWEAVDDQYHEQALKARNKVGVITGFSTFIRSFLQVGAMGTAAYLVLNVEGMTPGVMIASTIIMGKATAPILKVLGSWRSFLACRAAYQRLDELLQEQQSFTEGFKHSAPEGHLSVESLLFFLNRDRTILNGINFKLGAGEALGVIGSSASGKSSLARLLVGLYRPSDGAVRLDGADVHQWALNGLGDYIGYLPQDQQLFAGTVAENIARMGDAYKQVEAVVEAAKRAGIHDMILRLPKGYDTQIGIGGAVLSGGQRQLIGLARALFGRPRFVVLDEPNSSLDGQSELILLDMIRGLKADGVTVVIIAHKPSILQDMDKLLVLGQSKQLMFGPREEIMRRLDSPGGVVTSVGEAAKANKGDGGGLKRPGSPGGVVTPMGGTKKANREGGGGLKRPDSPGAVVAPMNGAVTANKGGGDGLKRSDSPGGVVAPMGGVAKASKEEGAV